MLNSPIHILGLRSPPNTVSGNSTGATLDNATLSKILNECKNRTCWYATLFGQRNEKKLLLTAVVESVKRNGEIGVDEGAIEDGLRMKMSS